FFFSSRRRHTRFSRDWSSDVCSSDLETFSGDTAWMAEDDYRREWGETIERPTPRGPRYFVRSKKFKPQRPNSFLGDYPLMRAARSEERRVGKECTSRWSPEDSKEILS